MSDQTYDKKVNLAVLLDSTQRKIQRELSYISDWLHDNHYGTMFLSKEEEKCKDKIILQAMEYLFPIIDNLNNEITYKTKEVQKEIFDLFSDKGHNEKETRKIISITCKSKIKEVLEFNPDFSYYSECGKIEEEYKKEQLDDIMKI